MHQRLKQSISWYRTPGSVWAGQTRFRWSNNCHATFVPAVQLHVAAGSCVPTAFASIVLSRNSVVQMMLYKVLPGSSLESPLGCFFVCTMPRWSAHPYWVYTRTTCCRMVTVARTDPLPVSHARCMSHCLPRPGN